jgi:hypothetical protein
MNLVWIAVIVIALAVSLGAFVLSSGVILYFFRRQKWWVRIMLLCIVPVSLCLLWDAWLGPHDLTEPGALAARFELVFQFPPEPEITDIHYRLGDGPDDMGEWFLFTADVKTLERLSTDLKPTSELEFRRLGGDSPSWWLPSTGGNVSFFNGSIRTRSGQSPWDRRTWIAYDHSKHLVYCYIHSLL